MRFSVPLVALLAVTALACGEAAAPNVTAPPTAAATQALTPVALTSGLQVIYFGSPG